MNYRTIGKTGITVSEIGFGAWGIGGETQDGANSYGKTDDAESKRALVNQIEIHLYRFETKFFDGRKSVARTFYRDADRADLAFGFHLLQFFNAFRMFFDERDRRTVKLVDIDIIGFQTAQAFFKTLS